MTEHVLTMPYRLRYPGGKNGMWVVSCSCGYSTSPHGSRERAKRTAEMHRKDKAEK